MSYMYTRETFVSAAPALIFAFLTDQSKLPLWAPDVVASEVVGGGRWQSGRAFARCGAAGAGRWPVMSR